MGSKLKVAGLIALGAVAGALTTMQLQATAQAQRQEMGNMLSQSHAATVQQLETMRRQIEVLTESNTRRLLEVRVALETKMRELQADNGARLEKMRKTVDEKLHETLVFPSPRGKVVRRRGTG